MGLEVIITPYASVLMDTNGFRTKTRMKRATLCKLLLT